MINKRKLNLADAGIAFIFGFVLSQFSAIIGISIVKEILQSFGKTPTQIELFLDGLWGILIQTICLDIGFILTFLYYYKKGLNKNELFTKPTSNNWQFFAVCLGIGVFTLFSLAGTLNYFELLVDKLGKSSATLSYEMDSFWKYIVSMISLALLPAICEELLFRGVIVNSLKSKSYMFAIFISSFMFAIFHFSLSQLIYPFCFGLILSVVYLKTDNLLFPMLLHFANNGLSVSIQYFSSPSATSTFTHSASMLMYAIITLGIWIAVIYKLIKYFKQTKQENQLSSNIGNSNQIAQTKNNNLIFGLCLVIMIALYIILITVG